MGPKLGGKWHPGPVVLNVDHSIQLMNLFCAQVLNCVSGDIKDLLFERLMTEFIFKFIHEWVLYFLSSVLLDL